MLRSVERTHASIGFRPDDQVLKFAERHFTRCEQLGKMSPVHGDLHVKNLFVRENSVDIVLIDFNRAGEAPASRDPAELEVSLAFSPAAPGEAAIDAATLQALYSGPLLKRTDLARQTHPRVLAIEQVRRQVAGAVSEVEYSAMVGAHCLYFARKGNVDAYLAANRLI